MGQYEDLNRMAEYEKSKLLQPINEVIDKAFGLIRYHGGSAKPEAKTIIKVATRGAIKSVPNPYPAGDMFNAFEQARQSILEPFE